MAKKRKRNEADHRREEKQQAAPSPSKQARQLIPVWPLYILLVVLAALYIFVRFTGPLLLVILVIIILFEIINMLGSGGGKRALAELGSVVLVIAAIWLVLVFALGNTSPVDVVPSCSMLPALHVGDLIFVRNVPPTQIRAPIVQVNASRASLFIKNLTSNTYECVAFNPSNPSTVSQYVLPGYSVGLYTYNKETGRGYLNPSQQGLIRFNCGSEPVAYSNGSMVEEATLTSISINNRTIYPNLNNSIIVYRTVKNDSFYNDGDTYIVHRAYAILDAQGEYYVLTKGDNNPGLDVQYMNAPPNASQIQGKVLFSIPYVGYVKLALSGVNPGSGCNQHFV